MIHAGLSDAHALFAHPFDSGDVHFLLFIGKSSPNATCNAENTSDFR
jgi:hypothetical protein